MFGVDRRLVGIATLSDSSSDVDGSLPLSWHRGDYGSCQFPCCGVVFDGASEFLG